MDGGQEWGGPAYDPETGLFYTNANEMAWVFSVVKRPPYTPVSSGKQLYQNNCATCHKSDHTGMPEIPSLIGIEQRYSTRDMPAIIQRGQGRMPAFTNLSAGEVAAISAYILSGKDNVVQSPAPDPSMAGYTLGAWRARFLDADGYPAITLPWGSLTAIDLNKW